MAPDSAVCTIRGVFSEHNSPLPTKEGKTAYERLQMKYSAVQTTILVSANSICASISILLRYVLTLLEGLRLSSQHTHRAHSFDHSSIL